MILVCSKPVIYDRPQDCGATGIVFFGYLIQFLVPVFGDTGSSDVHVPLLWSERVKLRGLCGCIRLSKLVAVDWAGSCHYNGLLASDRRGKRLRRVMALVGVRRYTTLRSETKSPERGTRPVGAVPSAPPGGTDLWQEGSVHCPSPSDAK